MLLNISAHDYGQGRGLPRLIPRSVDSRKGEARCMLLLQSHSHPTFSHVTLFKGAEGGKWLSDLKEQLDNPRVSESEPSSKPGSSDENRRAKDDSASESSEGSQGRRKRPRLSEPS